MAAVGQRPHGGCGIIVKERVGWCSADSGHCGWDEGLPESTLTWFTNVKGERVLCALRALC